MTTVCLKAKSSVKTEAWSSVFNAIHTDTASLVFIKQLTTTCISTILHLRKILPDYCFEAKSIEGIKVNLLKFRGGDKYVFKIQQWLIGAFDAIDKKYLKRLMLDIHDAETDTILEVYTMTYNYCHDKESQNPHHPRGVSNKDKFLVSNTKLNTIKLLQMCSAVAQAYRSLPSKIKLDIRLSYYEHTPDDYEPKGYMAWDNPDPQFSNQTRTVEIGTTGTPHHFFKLFNKSRLSDRFFKDMEDQLRKGRSNAAIEGDQTHHKKNDLQEKQMEVKKQSFGKNKENSKPGTFIVTEKNTPPRKSHKQRTKSLNEFKGQTVRCSCSFSKHSESMFSCTNCKFLVHSECFGILQFDSSRKIRFYCHVCHQEDSNSNVKCHDKILLNMKNSSDQQKLSLLRRALAYCNKPNIETVTLKILEKHVGVDHQNVMEIVLRKLVQMGVAVPQGKRKRHPVNKTELESKLWRYFYKLQDSALRKSRDMPYSLRSLVSLEKKNDTDSFGNKKNKTICSALQEKHAYDNKTASQQSYDIFM